MRCLLLSHIAFVGQALTSRLFVDCCLAFGRGQAAERAEKFRDKHHTLLVEIRAARNALIRGIVGDQADVSLYKHVKLPDLIRQQTEAAFAAGEHTKMRGILATIEAGSSSSSRPASRAGSVTSTARKGGARPSPVPPHSGRSKARTGNGAGAGSGGDGDESRPSTGGENDETKRSEDAGGMDATARSARDDADGAVSTIIEAEKEIAALRRKNLRLNDRIQELQDILEEYEGKLERMGVLQHRMERVGDQARFEKTQRERAENEIVRGEEKVEALSEHIEKLMLHLKHEAAAKAKAFEAQRRSTWTAFHRELFVVLPPLYTLHALAGNARQTCKAYSDWLWVC